MRLRNIVDNNLIGTEASTSHPNTTFVYRLGHWVFIPGRAVQLCYVVPLLQCASRDVKFKTSLFLASLGNLLMMV